MQVYNQTPSGSAYIRTNHLPKLKETSSFQLEPSQDVYFGASRTGGFRKGLTSIFSSGGGGEPPRRPRKSLPKGHTVAEESQGAGSGGVRRARRSQSPSPSPSSREGDSASEAVVEMSASYINSKRTEIRRKNPKVVGAELNKLYDEAGVPISTKKPGQALTSGGKKSRRKAIRERNPEATEEAIHKLYEEAGVPITHPLNKPVDKLTRSGKRDRRKAIRERNPEATEEAIHKLYEEAGIPIKYAPRGNEPWRNNVSVFDSLQHQQPQGYSAEYGNAAASQTSSGSRFNLGGLREGLESNSSFPQRTGTGLLSQANPSTTSLALTENSASSSLPQGSAPALVSYPPQAFPAAYNPDSPISYTPQAQVARSPLVQPFPISYPPQASPAAYNPGSPINYPSLHSPAAYNPGSPISYTPQPQVESSPVWHPDSPINYPSLHSPAAYNPGSPISYTPQPQVASSPLFQPPSPTTHYPFQASDTRDFIRQFEQLFDELPMASDFPAADRPWTPVQEDGTPVYQRTEQAYRRSSNNSRTGNLYTATDPNTGHPSFYARSGRPEPENSRFAQMELYDPQEHLMQANSGHKRHASTHDPSASTGRRKRK